MVKMFSCFSDRMAEWGRNVIKVTLTMKWLLVPDREVWVSQKLLISWDFHAQRVSRVCRERYENIQEKTSSEQQFCGRNVLVNERGQRRMARLVKADRKVTVMQITTHYNSSMYKSISENNYRLGYSSRRPIHLKNNLSVWDTPSWLPAAFAHQLAGVMCHSKGTVTPNAFYSEHFFQENTHIHMHKNGHGRVYPHTHHKSTHIHTHTQTQTHTHTHTLCESINQRSWSCMEYF